MKNNVLLTFCGDIMCLREQISAVTHGRQTYNDMFSCVRPLLDRSDYVVGNFETPLAGATCGFASGQMSFNAPDGFLEAVQWAGFDFLTLANNHCMDRGIVGLERTIRQIRLAGLGTTGAYLTREESEQICVKVIGEIRFAFVSCTYAFNQSPDILGKDDDWRIDLLTGLSIGGVPKRDTLRSRLARVQPRLLVALRRAWAEVYKGRHQSYAADTIYPKRIGTLKDEIYRERIYRKIQAVKKVADVVIVLPHIGGQYNPAPGEFQKKTMHWMSESGADLIVANHAHVPLRCERFPSGAIGAYALGNFCFTPGVGYYLPGALAEYSVALHVKFIKDEIGVRLGPVTFSVLKSVSNGYGGAVVVPVPQLLSETHDLFARERLILENEAVVNRFRGGSSTVAVAEEYTFND